MDHKGSSSTGCILTKRQSLEIEKYQGRNKSTGCILTAAPFLKGQSSEIKEEPLK